MAELRAAGAVRVYVVHGHSSRAADRPQWLACLDHPQPDATLLIRAFDRIAGTEISAIETNRDPGKRGVRLQSHTEPFTVLTPARRRARRCIFPTCTILRYPHS